MLDKLPNKMPDSRMNSIKKSRYVSQQRLCSSVTVLLGQYALNLFH